MNAHFIFLYAGQNRFIYAIYEQAENSEDTFLWMYHPQITLQHLQQTMQSDIHSCPILYKFLCQVMNAIPPNYVKSNLFPFRSNILELLGAFLT